MIIRKQVSHIIWIKIGTSWVFRVADNDSEVRL